MFVLFIKYSIKNYFKFFLVVELYFSYEVIFFIVFFNIRNGYYFWIFFLLWRNMGFKIEFCFCRCDGYKFLCLVGWLVLGERKNFGSIRRWVDWFSVFWSYFCMIGIVYFYFCLCNLYFNRRCMIKILCNIFLIIKWFKCLKFVRFFL